MKRKNITFRLLVTELFLKGSFLGGKLYESNSEVLVKQKILLSMLWTLTKNVEKIICVEIVYKTVQ